VIDGAVRDSEPFASSASDVRGRTEPERTDEVRSRTARTIRSRSAASQ
jgi:hypothetical protein